MPPRARNREEIDIVRDIPQNLVRGVMLEEEEHVNSNSADAFEDVAALHVLWVAAPAVEDVVVVETADLRDSGESFADSGLVEVGGVVVEEGVSDIFV
jgi:hypothetical protein